MSKVFRVTVNGQAYEVVVEEVGNSAPTQEIAAAKPALRPEPKPVAAAQPRPEPKPATPAPKKPAAPAAAGGKGVITAPIPGVITEVKAQAGQKLAAGAVVMVLEAMKMQNEISAPHAGTVREIFVASGATVNTGDQLVAIDPE